MAKIEYKVELVTPAVTAKSGTIRCNSQKEYRRTVVLFC